MNDLSLPRSRRRLFWALLVTISLLVGYGLIEIAYRAYLYYVYVIEPNFTVTTTDVRPFNQLGATPGSVYGYYQPRKPITFTSYDEAGNILQRHTVQINNYGWVSQYDYSRAKPPDEYRIAIIGDSMTASINNDHPWPDALQRNLNADRQLLQALGVKHISVLNLGVAGASMQLMANPLALIARRFSADMVVINFIADDLRRRHGDAFADTNPAPAVPAEPVVPDETPPVVAPPHMLIDGFGIDLIACDPPYEVSLVACQVSPYFFVPHGAQFDKEDINRIKAKLGSDVFRYRVATSIKPFFLLDVLGRPAVQRLPAPKILRKLLGASPYATSDVTHMSDLTQPQYKEDEDLVIAVRVMKFIKSLHKEVMLTHNPTYWYLTGQMREPAMERLSAAGKLVGLEAIRMEKYLPINRSERDWYGWYNLPRDGHWTDFGADIYGEAVYEAVRERLFAKVRHN